ncbi:sensor histidine kinase [Streptosporangium sp. 'caverna']|uniref:sensor histidine kinase n=1 Tax=Streptosporangium sp. 'caverna' TaxID=2202249 RepID=UPI000D7D6011|nr:sensor histidine kinase [Streptosporangium sp. 'caverna']AWS42469.1 histidine kinase [Streptosporangium sp. 'caverna']
MKLASALTFGGTGENPSRWRRLPGMAIGLVYLCFPMLDLVTGNVTGAKAVWGAFGLVTFIVCYIAVVMSQRTFGKPTLLSHLLIAAVTVLAVGLPLLFGGGWLTLPIYMTVLYSMALSTRAAVVGIVGMGVTVALIGLLKQNDPGTTLVLVFQVATLGILFMSVRNTRLLVTQLRQAQEEVARLAASEERLRIARDLHDLLGHSLSLIVLKSELAGRLAESGSERAVAEINDIESVAREALVEVRDAVTAYRQRGLSGELDGARAAMEAAGTRVTVRLAGTPLPDALDGLLGWAVREGATNVIRHARATRCEIEVTCDGESTVLEIVDDGRGAAPYGPGSGLTGLTERVEAAGGTVSAGPGETGFALRVAVPTAAGGRA